MIYEAILYQGMTIDLNKKANHTRTHAASDINDQTHKSESVQFRVMLFYADPTCLLGVVLINTRTHKATS